MNSLVALAVHAISFWTAVAFIGGHQVAVPAWAVLFAVGAVAVLVASRGALPSLGSRRAALLFLYSVVLGGLFFGADFALNVLGNSVLPRAQLPGYLGGLELYFVLVPGLASASLGVFASRFFASRSTQTLCS